MGVPGFLLLLLGGRTLADLPSTRTPSAARTAPQPAKAPPLAPAKAPPPAKAPAPASPPHFARMPASKRYDVRMAYVDPTASRAAGGHGASVTLVLDVSVWALDEVHALQCAREQFHDRVSYWSPSARLVPGMIAKRSA